MPLIQLLEDIIIIICQYIDIDHDYCLNRCRDNMQWIELFGIYDLVRACSHIYNINYQLMLFHPSQKADAFCMEEKLYVYLVQLIWVTFDIAYVIDIVNVAL